MALKCFFSIFFLLQLQLSYAAGERHLALIVTDDGHYPSYISAFVGETLHLMVTSLSSDKSCLQIEGHDLFIAAEKGVINEGKIKLRKSGRFSFSCPGLKHKGYLTVISKTLEERVIAPLERETASHDYRGLPSKYWMPRDYDE